MARRTRAEELSIATGPIFLATCQFLNERGLPLSMADMRALMERMERAAEQAAEGTEPPEDLNATADFKRHLARVMCRRALEEAVAAA